MDPVLAKLVGEGMIFAGVIVVAACGTLLALRRIKAHHAEVNRGDIARNIDEVKVQLQRLENTVDATAIEVERISEGQRFTSRILAERTGDDRMLPPGGGATGKGRRAE